MGQFFGKHMAAQISIPVVIQKHIGKYRKMMGGSYKKLGQECSPQIDNFDHALEMSS